MITIFNGLDKLNAKIKFNAVTQGCVIINLLILTISFTSESLSNTNNYFTKGAQTIPSITSANVRPESM
jgi:hypothetical protein